LLEDAVVYPHGQKKNAADAKRKMEQLIRKYQIPVVAIGNGTGCRETEQLVADLISDLEQRRLNPTPPAPAATTEASSTPVAAPSIVTPDTAAPEATHTPTESFVSSAGLMPTDANTITSIVTITAPPIETTGVAPPSAETVTTGVHATPVAPAPQPQTPPISLEGLPDAPSELAYVIVIEAGASDYSASPVAREEFPELDATTRGTISIGRRLQDPLAELVKIDPQHIGVGLYQHDVKQKHLKESLEAVIGSSVNTVGVDLNTASVPLLRHVSGLNQLVARELVGHRERNGKFSTREQVLSIPGLGEKRYTQAAGFLKIPDGAEPLDATWIHPESYALARQILTELGFTPQDLRDRAKVEELRAKLNSVNLPEFAAKFATTELTIHDIFSALARPGRDPREDVPPPIFKKGVLKLEDISQGMELKGTVLNVVPFGAFVDIGLKESGLVHISQMANRYIKSPYDVVAVGDVITVWVMEVKPGEKKISLSMIPPGQERRPGGAGGRFGGQPQGRSDRPGPGGPPQQQESQQAADRPQFQARGDRPQFQPRGDRPGGFQRGGQGQGAGRFSRGPGGAGPGGRGPGGPPRQGDAPAASGSSQPPVQQPPPPPRKPSKPKPLPNLTADKKAGKAALNTFAELAAFFKKDEPKPLPEESRPVEAATPPVEPQAPSESKPEPLAEEQKPTEGSPPA
jgi:uncharacterized protein